MDSATKSLVTHSYKFRADYKQVMSEVIHIMSVLGRKGPEVDRLLGKVSGAVRKKATPFRMCHAEITVSKEGPLTSVFVALRCEQDEEVNRTYCLSALRQITGWLLVKGKLNPVID
jgi:hypothetical protein